MFVELGRTPPIKPGGGGGFGPRKLHAGIVNRVYPSCASRCLFPRNDSEAIRGSPAAE